MSIDALAITRFRDIFDMRSDCFTSQIQTLLVGNLWVFHGLAPSHTLLGTCATCLGSAELEFPSCRGFIGRTTDVVHLVVSELNHHLCPGVRGRFELFNLFGAISLVV